jgi:hypothetical protein
MRKWLLLLLLTGALVAQTVTLPTIKVPVLPEDFVAAGLAWNQYASPQINGWTTYARSIKASAGLYSFTTYDITSVKANPFTIQTSARTGAALYLRSIGPIHIFGLGDVGMAASGQSIGSAFSGGGVVAVQLGKGWTVLGVARVLKTALSDQQTIYGLGVGWGR